MLTIKNVFIPSSNVKVQWKKLNGQWSDPISGGVSFEPPRGIIKEVLIIQAFIQNQGSKDSSIGIRISNLPDDHSINISYNKTDKTWTLEKEIDFLIKCSGHVNVEIGPLP